MKNLKLIKNNLQKLNLSTDSSVQEFCIDNNFQYIYILFTNGITSRYNINSEQSENFHVAFPPIKLTLLCVTSEIAIIDRDCICIFSQNDLESLSSKFTFDELCTAAEYSPGQDLLAIVTETHKIQLLMLDSYGCWSTLETLLLDEYKFINQFINVGWGSKETQFHGSEGKDARKQVIKVDDLVETDIGDGSSCISWRGDGQYFAVSFLRGLDYAFLVVDRDGGALYASEICQGLETPLAWRPSGNLIAGVQQLPNKYQIVFFEKNGLRHGEFTISDQLKVVKLSWSIDSEVLCIQYENNSIELWTVNNYHWYLKQSLNFNKKMNSVNAMWDTNFEHFNSKTLHVCINNEQLFSYEWIWDVNHSKGCQQTDLACVGVIDGSNALLTSFKLSSIPPPMAGVTLKHTKPINCLLFGPYSRTNDVCVILDDYMGIQYTCSLQFQFDLVRTMSFHSNNSLPLTNIHLLWCQDDLFVGYCNNKLQFYQFSSSTAVVDEIVVDESILAIELVANCQEIICQLMNGQIVNINLNTKVLRPIFKYSTPCESMKLDMDGRVYALDRFNRFYINEQCLANNILSYFLLEKFLLLTTTQHYLICLRLGADFDANTFKRRIEHGAKIIVGVSSGQKVVLQMPRGNLESISPRALSLDVIGDLLDSRQYLQAFKLMKRERINLNLLYDHNPVDFHANLNDIVQQLDVLSLNMFLLELHDDDVCTTMYSTCYTTRKSAEHKKATAVNALLTVLTNLLNIVTADLVIGTRAHLEDALERIFNAKSNGRVDEASKALEHMLLLKPVDELYQIALGMYNFDLIKFVASKSQKDPKQYIPFLNDLNRLDDNYKRFTINTHLKRYQEALVHLAKCPERFDECQQFVQQHQLYKEALQLFTHDKYKAICLCFGDYLVAKRCYSEAAIMYERGGNLQKALNMYKLDLNWRQCIIVGLKLQMDTASDKFKLLLKELAAELIVQRQYKDAAHLYMEYICDCDEAVRTLVDGKLWSDALLLVYSHQRLDLLETQVKPKLISHAEIVGEQLKTIGDEFAKQTDRLMTIRQKLKNEQKQQLQHYSLDEPREQQVLDSDLYSDTASVTSKTSTKSSTSSFKSFRSSKNRRKHERKVLSLKEGSKYEDLALIRALHQSITNTLAMRTEINSLCTHLLLFNMDQVAKQLQTLLDSILCQMKQSEKDIWNVQHSVDSNNQLTFGPNVSTNSAVQMLQQHAQIEQIADLEPQFKYPPERGTMHWKIFTLD